MMVPAPTPLHPSEGASEAKDEPAACMVQLVLMPRETVVLKASQALLSSVQGQPYHLLVLPCMDAAAAHGSEQHKPSTSSL
jgi:hypothetical protein